MKPVASVVGVILAVATVLGFSWSILATTQMTSADSASGSIGVGRPHERLHRVDSIMFPDHSVAGNPPESSFGTLQSDSTYCGAFCAENH